MKQQKEIKGWMMKGSDGYWLIYPEKQEADFFAEYLYPRKKAKVIQVSLKLLK